MYFPTICSEKCIATDADIRAKTDLLWANEFATVTDAYFATIAEAAR
jgi:hypothetical protein